MAILVRPDAYLYMRDQRFFTRMAMGIAAFIVFAFAQWALRGFVAPATVPIWVHMHAMAMLAWLGLLITQNVLMNAGNLSLHRKLGWLGLALVLVIAGLGIFTGRMAVETHRVPPFFSNAYFLALTHVEAVFFALIVCLAIALRRRTQFHRRFVLGATIILLEPAFGRLLPAPVLGPVALPLVQLALQLGVVGLIARHDMKRNSMIHPATRLIAIMLLTMTVLTLGLAMFAPFVSFAESIAAG